MSDLNLGAHFEAFIGAQLASGRYADASDVIRDGLRLLESRERRVSALDAALERGWEDVEAGRVYDADEVFDELEKELEARIDASRG